MIMMKRDFNILTLILFFLLLPCAGTSDLHAQTSGQKVMSPAARRAFVRDSLRKVRLQKRMERAKQKNSPISTKKAQSASAPASKPAKAKAFTTPSAKTYPKRSSANKKTPGIRKPGNKRPESRHTQKPVSLPIADSLILDELSVRDTEIRDVLSALAAQYSLNLFVDKAVTGPISISLTKIQLKKALRLIVQENGYELQVRHGAIKVIKPAPPVPEPPPEPPFDIKLKDGKITADIKEIPVESVMRKLTDLTGRNIVVERGAQGPITAYYKNMELDKAVKLIVESNGFRLREQDGVITVYKDDWVMPSKDGKTALSGKTRVYVKNGLVTMEVNNTPLQQILSAITSQGGLSAIIYGSVTGSITAKLNNIPVNNALQYLFRGTEFTFWLRDSIYFIGSKKMKAITNSKLIVLESVKADEIMELIPPELISNMKVKVVPSQNAIMAMGTYEAITNLEDYISKIDLPVAQILIEALVVDIDMDKIRSYGLDLFLGNARSARGQETLYPSFNMTYNKKDSENILRMIGLENVISLPKGFVAKIQALEQEKVLKIKSRPQIATLNGKTASITVGQTQYFLLKQETDFNQTVNTTTRTQERFEKIQADVTLTVTPFVTGKGEITVEIIPDFSEPEGTFNSSVPPTINRRHLKSTVRLREGETIVLGGLVKESVNSDRRQFPILGSIPIIGWLFKNQNTTKSRTQLMIFVTPYIYYGEDANVDVDTYMDNLGD